MTKVVRRFLDHAKQQSVAAGESMQETARRAAEERAFRREEGLASGALGMFGQLWKKSAIDKMTLIGLLIFNPNRLKELYEEEIAFSRNLKDRWQK